MSLSWQRKEGKPKKGFDIEIERRRKNSSHSERGGR